MLADLDNESYANLGITLLWRHGITSFLQLAKISVITSMSQINQITSTACHRTGDRNSDKKVGAKRGVFHYLRCQKLVQFNTFKTN